MRGNGNQQTLSSPTLRGSVTSTVEIDSQEVISRDHYYNLGEQEKALIEKIKTDNKTKEQREITASRMRKARQQPVVQEKLFSRNLITIDGQKKPLNQAFLGYKDAIEQVNRQTDVIKELQKDKFPNPAAILPAIEAAEAAMKKIDEARTALPKLPHLSYQSISVAQDIVDTEVALATNLQYFRDLHELALLKREVKAEQEKVFESEKENMKAAFEALDNHNDREMQALLQADNDSYKLGFGGETSVSEFNAMEKKDRPDLYLQPEIGEEIETSIDRMIEACEMWGGLENEEMARDLKQLKEEGETTIRGRVKEYGIMNGVFDATLEKDQLPLLVDQDNRPVIDEGICVSIEYHKFGLVDNVDPYHVGLPDANDSTETLTKITR